MVSGRSSSLAHLGSKDHQFIDANVVSLTQGPQSYESELDFYKEPGLEFPTKVVFTFFDRIQNYPVAELEVELRNKQLRWIKPWTHYRTTPFDVELELIQDLDILQHQWSIAV
uniref:Uncharacterized protein n=1 Tax=Pseudomonas phage RVTF4 TaxID=3236931 RepID=A0AB39CDJ9_9VIRU